MLSKVATFKSSVLCCGVYWNNRTFINKVLFSYEKLCQNLVDLCLLSCRVIVLKPTLLDKNKIMIKGVNSLTKELYCLLIFQPKCLSDDWKTLAIPSHPHPSYVAIRRLRLTVFVISETGTTCHILCIQLTTMRQRKCRSRKCTWTSATKVRFMRYQKHLQKVILRFYKRETLRMKCKNVHLVNHPTPIKRHCTAASESGRNELWYSALSCLLCSGVIRLASCVQMGKLSNLFWAQIFPFVLKLIVTEQPQWNDRSTVREKQGVLCHRLHL